MLESQQRAVKSQPCAVSGGGVPFINVESMKDCTFILLLASHAPSSVTTVVTKVTCPPSGFSE